MLVYDADWPLIKENDNEKDLLTPKFSLRFSPNDTKNLTDEKRLLTTDNIFSLNRVGFSETIESGGSLTLGLDYEKKSKKVRLYTKRMEQHESNQKIGEKTRQS